MRRRHWIRRLVYWAAGFAVVFIVLCNRWVINSTDGFIYTNWALLPENDVGLVLGTSPWTEGRKPNPQFRGRIDAAVLLYNNGKVKHLLVSGSNPNDSYNEPRQMWRALTAAGIPSKDITMDFAGERTLDSVQRAADVFGLQRITIVTQRYHTYRAVFLGKKLGIRTVAFVARAAADGDYGSRNPPREIFARVLAVLDLFVLRTRPKFLGPKEPIDLEHGAEPGGSDNPDNRETPGTDQTPT